MMSLAKLPNCLFPEKSQGKGEDQVPPLPRAGQSINFIGELNMFCQRVLRRALAQDDVVRLRIPRQYFLTSPDYFSYAPRHGYLGTGTTQAKQIGNP